METLGIERSYQAIADADLTLIVVDASSPDPDDRPLIERARQSGRYLLVANKADLPRPSPPVPEALLVSALTGSGIDALRERVLQAISPNGSIEQEEGFITSIRHENLLRESLDAMDNAARRWRAPSHASGLNQ